MASDAVCNNEYLIHHDYLLVWFNMACIMKRNTITSEMQPDSCPTGAGGHTCWWTFSSRVTLFIFPPSFSFYFYFTVNHGKPIIWLDVYLLEHIVAW